MYTGSSWVGVNRPNKSSQCPPSRSVNPHEGPRYKVCLNHARRCTHGHTSQISNSSLLQHLLSFRIATVELEWHPLCVRQVHPCVRSPAHMHLLWVAYHFLSGIATHMWLRYSWGESLTTTTVRSVYIRSMVKVRKSEPLQSGVLVWRVWIYHYLDKSKMDEWYQGWSSTCLPQWGRL